MAPVDYTVFRPRTVVVQGLRPTVSPLCLDSYFGNFGEVHSVAIKVKQATTYAFVKYVDEEAVSKLLFAAPHVIERQHVQVRRAFKYATLPASPFPCMALQRHPVPSAWTQDTAMWDCAQFAKIRALWDD